MIGSIFPACQFFQPAWGGWVPASDLPRTGRGDDDSKAQVEMGRGMRARGSGNHLVRSRPTGGALIRLVAGLCESGPTALGLAGPFVYPDVRDILREGSALGRLSQAH